MRLPNLMTTNSRLVMSSRHYIVLFIILTLLIMAGCPWNSKVVRHGFYFDANFDSPDAVILDYHYGDSRHAGARAESGRYGGRAAQQSGIYGAMRRGDELYVKWRVISTGEVYEDTVDLKRLLPSYIKGKRIYFIVSGSQLHVYLISYKKHKKNPCPSRDERARLLKTYIPDNIIFSTYCSRKILKVYSDKFKHAEGDKP